MKLILVEPNINITITNTSIIYFDHKHVGITAHIIINQNRKLYMNSDFKFSNLCCWSNNSIYFITFTILPNQHISFGPKPTTVYQYSVDDDIYNESSTRFWPITLCIQKCRCLPKAISFCINNRQICFDENKECEICLIKPQPNNYIFCTNFHNICTSCRLKVKSCPFCRGSFLSYSETRVLYHHKHIDFVLLQNFNSVIKLNRCDVYKVQTKLNL